MRQLISSLPVVYIKPGEFHLSNKPELLVTVLGSCVAVIMYDIEAGMCAIAHCVLPYSEKYSLDEPRNDFRYVDTAVIKMLKIFRAKGIAKKKIFVKLFGGAEQLKQHVKISVGEQNIDAAIRMFEKERMHVISMDVGGNVGRKIHVSSHTGEVLLSRLGVKIIKLDEVK